MLEITNLQEGLLAVTIDGVPASNAEISVSVGPGASVTTDQEGTWFVPDADFVGQSSVSVEYQFSGVPVLHTEVVDIKDFVAPVTGVTFSKLRTRA